MPRRQRDDKPIRPWKEALADTWIFPACTAGMVGLHWLPGGADWLLRVATCSCVVVTLLAYGAAVRYHRRRARWLQVPVCRGDTPPRRQVASDPFSAN